MRTVLTEASIILADEKRKPLSWRSEPGPHGENHELLEKLFHYYSYIDVRSYIEYKDGVEWFINGEPYCEEQIKRMIALKAFF